MLSYGGTPNFISGKLQTNNLRFKYYGYNIMFYDMSTRNLKNLIYISIRFVSPMTDIDGIRNV